MASAYIYKTLAANNQKKLTISAWVKIAKVQEQMIVNSYYSGSYWGSLYFGSDGSLRFDDYRTSYILKVRSTELYRDTNAWYHIVANFDCSIGSPTAKLYVNGSEVNYLHQTIYSQNATTSWNTDYSFQIGKGTDLGGNNFNGVMSDLYFIQGYTYDASTFGEIDSTTNLWKPKTNPTINYGGTGGNSCHLKFENSGNMDLDSGSNNITFTTSGTLTQTQDCPSNVFATYNPLDNYFANSTFTNGNTTIVTNSSNTTYNTSTLGIPSTMKCYWEAKFDTVQSANGEVGIVNTPTTGSAAGGGASRLYYQTYGISVNDGGAVWSANADTGITLGTLSTSDVVCFAWDGVNQALYVRKNADAWINSGNPTSGASKTGAVKSFSGTRTMFPAVGDQSGSHAVGTSTNFGNGFFGTTAISSEGTNASGIGKFEYDVPAGYTALSTRGLNE